MAALDQFKSFRANGVKVRSRQNTPFHALKQAGGLPGIARCLALGVLRQLARIARTLPGHCGGLE